MILPIVQTRKLRLGDGTERTRVTQQASFPPSFHKQITSTGSDPAVLHPDLFRASQTQTLFIENVLPD